MIKQNMVRRVSGYVAILKSRFVGGQFKASILTAGGGNKTPKKATEYFRSNAFPVPAVILVCTIFFAD